MNEGDSRVIFQAEKPGQPSISVLQRLHPAQRWVAQQDGANRQIHQDRRGRARRRRRGRDDQARRPGQGDHRPTEEHQTREADRQGGQRRRASRNAHGNQNKEAHLLLPCLSRFQDHQGRQAHTGRGGERTHRKPPHHGQIGTLQPACEQRR